MKDYKNCGHKDVCVHNMKRILEGKEFIEKCLGCTYWEPIFSPDELKTIDNVMGHFYYINNHNIKCRTISEKLKEWIK